MDRRNIVWKKNGNVLHYTAIQIFLVPTKNNE